MRTLNRNKQKMYYSIQGELEPVYELDSQGKVVKIIVDGKSVPVETGEYTRKYSTPVEFIANINGKLSEVTLQAFGIDNSSKYCELVVTKGALQIKINSIVWRTNEIVYLSDGTPDKDSADYVVRGVMTESLNSDIYLLKRLSTGDENEVQD